MSIEFISIKCPDCGAALNIESGRKQAFCTYCGGRILIYNSNEHTYNRNENTFRHYENVNRTYDEADMYRAETERIMQQQRMYMTEYHQNEARKNERIATILTILGALTLPAFPVSIALFLAARSFRKKARSIY